MRYLTIVFRPDRRITIGTKIHKSYSCPKIVNPASARAVTGEILKLLSKCKHCFGRGK